MGVFEAGWSNSYVRLFARLTNPIGAATAISNAPLPGAVHLWGGALSGGLASFLIEFPATGNFPFGFDVEPD